VRSNVGKQQPAVVLNLLGFCLSEWPVHGHGGQEHFGGGYEVVNFFGEFHETVLLPL